MKYSQIVIVKRWIPILKEYERTKAKVNPRLFLYFWPCLPANKSRIFKFFFNFVRVSRIILQEPL